MAQGTHKLGGGYAGDNLYLSSRSPQLRGGMPRPYTYIQLFIGGLASLVQGFLWGVLFVVVGVVWLGGITVLKLVVSNRLLLYLGTCRVCSPIW